MFNFGRCMCREGQSGGVHAASIKCFVKCVFIMLHYFFDLLETMPVLPDTKENKRKDKPKEEK